MANQVQELANLEVNQTNIKRILSLTKNQVIMNSSKGKDVVVFIGNTGSAKSTLVNYLVPKKLIVDKYDNIILEDPNDSSAMVIGVSNVSQTLHPKFIECNQLLLYDLPGLKDNRGTAVNLVNAVFIKNIVESAKTVRFVFVAGMDEITASRGELIMQLLKGIEKLIPNQTMSEISGFVVTKSPPNKNIDDLVEQLNAVMGDGLNKWHKKKCLAKMEKVNNKIINQNDRENILQMINKIKPNYVKYINTSVIFNFNDGMQIINIYIEEMKEAFNCVLRKIINTSKIEDYALPELEKKIIDLKKEFNDFRFDSSTIIPLLKTISSDEYNKALIEFKKSLENDVEKIVLSITVEIKEKKRKKVEQELEEKALEQKLKDKELRRRISLLESELESSKTNQASENEMITKQQQLLETVQKLISDQKMAEQKFQKERLSYLKELEEKDKIIDEKTKKILEKGTCVLL